jgi:uncharacterized protein (TIGR00369 family)
MLHSHRYFTTMPSESRTRASNTIAPRRASTVMDLARLPILFLLRPASASIVTMSTDSSNQTAPAAASGKVPRTALIDGYPPRHHLLRDLRISVEFQKGWRSIVRAPVVPEVCSDHGGMRVGVIATLIDVLGGTLSIRMVYPDWIATADLSIHTAQRASSGFVAASGSVTRAGRTRVVIEVEIRQEAPGPEHASHAIGSAMMTFSRLSSGKDTPEVQIDDNLSEVVDFALEGSGLDRPCLDAFGVRVVDPARGLVEIEMRDYLRNSLGSLQGGMFAILADTAGQHAARAATGKPLTTSDLAIHYLMPGKVGPFRTRATVLRTTADTALTRVDVIDSGGEDRAIAVVMNTATLDRAT